MWRTLGEYGRTSAKTTSRAYQRYRRFCMAHVRVLPPVKRSHEAIPIPDTALR